MLVLCNYMEQSDRFCPVLEASSARAANEDSQDSLDMAEANWGRLEMAVVSFASQVETACLLTSIAPQQHSREICSGSEEVYGGWLVRR